MHRHPTFSGLALTALTLFLVSAGGPAAAQELVRTRHQYAAKVVCSFLTPFQDGILAQGIYRTAINIHNPNNHTVKLAAKVAIADTFGSEPSQFSVTPYRSIKLGPDGATRIDCGTIAGYYCPFGDTSICVDFGFFDGFVVIQSESELDVVGVYTARHSGQDDEVETLDVEEVEGRTVRQTLTISPQSLGEIRERIRLPSAPPENR